jgi:metal-responsive CopG/Arc/MetJ family transcriptional regulator
VRLCGAETIQVCLDTRHSMQKVTVSLTDENLEQIETIKEDKNLSRSAAIREILERYEELHTNYEDLHTRHKQLNERHTELLDRYDERESLVEFVKAEQKKRKASLSTRLKWFLFCMD